MFTVNGELNKLTYISAKTDWSRFNRTHRVVTLRPEVIKWLEDYFDNDADKLMFVFENWRVKETSGIYGPHCLVIAFREEQDAIAFKLTWC